MFSHSHIIYDTVLLQLKRTCAFFLFPLSFVIFSVAAFAQQDTQSSSNSENNFPTQWQHFEVLKGDNLSLIFNRAGLTAQDVLKVSNATSKERTFVRMIPGETLSLLITQGDLKEIKYKISSNTNIVLVGDKNTDSFTISKQSIIAPNQENIQPSISESTRKTAEPSTNNVPAEFINAADFNAIERTIIEVTKTDQLDDIFQKAGLTKDDLSNIIQASSEKDYFAKLQSGDVFDFLIVDNSLLEIKYTNGDKKTHTFIRQVDNSKHFVYANNSDTTIVKVKTAPVDHQLSALINKPISKKDLWIYYNVQSGDNLSTMFIRAGLSHTDVHYVDSATREANLFRRMMIGEKLAFLIRANELIKVKYIINPLKSVLISRVDKTTYQHQVLERKPITEEAFASGEIKSSLYIDALNAGMSSNVTMNFAKVFSWDLDFSQDLQPGDKFQVIYEKLTIDGNKIKDGNILAAQFITGGQNLIGIFFKDSFGGVGFYTPEGRSMRKAFLRMPVEFARISSKFNPRRRHPISNKIRAHQGVDYAAKRGTPIMASGNGKIVFRGRKRGYGNTIIIQHGSDTNTLYAHMSGFNKDFSIGSRIQQGQVLGYVGSTGAATGSHLHYEFRVNGVHKNPLTVKLKKASSLAPKEMANFKLVAKKVLDKFNIKSDEYIASKATNPKI